MPGIPKARIAQRLVEAVSSSRWIQFERGEFSRKPIGLPYLLRVALGRGEQREFALYFWSVSHGGRSRSDDEYRIQLKLEDDFALRFDSDTTILLGYYDAALDRVGSSLGNEPPNGMEVIVAWDPMKHMFLGRSSSCQVRFRSMLAAHRRGVAMTERACDDGSAEQVYCFRPEFLGRYLYCARAGHRLIREAIL